MSDIDLRRLLSLTPHYLATNPSLQLAQKMVEVVNDSQMSGAASGSLTLTEAEQHYYRMLCGQLSDFVNARHTEGPQRELTTIQALRLIPVAEFSSQRTDNGSQTFYRQDPKVLSIISSLAAIDGDASHLSVAELNILESALTLYSDPQTLSPDALEVPHDYSTLNSNRPYMPYEGQNTQVLSSSTIDNHAPIHLTFLNNPSLPIPAELRQLFSQLSQGQTVLHFNQVQNAYQHLSQREKESLPPLELLFASLRSLAYQAESGARIERQSVQEALVVSRAVSEQVLADLYEINEGFTRRAQDLVQEGVVNALENRFLAESPLALMQQSIHERNAALNRLERLMHLSVEEASQEEANYQPDGSLKTALNYLGRRRLQDPTHPDSRAYDILVNLLRAPTLLKIRQTPSLEDQTRAFMRLASHFRQLTIRQGASGALIYPAEISNLQAARQIYRSVLALSPSVDDGPASINSFRRVATYLLQDSTGDILTNSSGEVISHGEGSANVLAPWRIFSYSSSAGFHIRNFSDEEAEAAPAKFGTSLAVAVAVVGALYLLKNRAIPYLKNLPLFSPVASVASQVETGAMGFLTRMAPSFITTTARAFSQLAVAANTYMQANYPLLLRSATFMFQAPSQVLNFITHSSLVLGVGNVLMTAIASPSLRRPLVYTPLYIGPLHSNLSALMMFQARPY